MHGKTREKSLGSGAGAKAREAWALTKTLGSVTVFLTLCTLLLGAGVAAARTITPYVYSGNSFNGSGSTAGAFEKPSYLGVDDQTGDVYVMDGGHGGVLDRFDAAGTPAPFAAPTLSSASSIVLGTWIGGPSSLSLGAGIAIDNSGTASQGNIYAMRAAEPPGLPLVFGFSSSGESLGPEWPLCGAQCDRKDLWQGIEDVAVGPDGTLWVSDAPISSAPNLLTPIDPSTGTPSSIHSKVVMGRNAEPLTGESPSELALDNSGNIYSVGFPLDCGGCSTAVLKYGSDGHLLSSSFTPSVPIKINSGVFKADGQIAIDTSSGNLIVDFGDHIEIYNPNGQRVDSFGAGVLVKSTGVAVNSATHKIYVSNTASGGKVEVYEPGSPVVVPTATTESASGISQETATLNGVVNTDNGGKTTACFFQYGRDSNSLSSTVPCAQGTELVSSGSPQPVSATLSGLACAFPGLCPGTLPFEFGSKFYFRLVTKNATGSEQAGQIRTFRNAQKPSIGSPSIVNPKPDGADIAVNIGPEGDETKYVVEVGTTTGYGLSVNGQLPLGLFERPTKAKNLVIHVGGLEPNTTYHYKVVATNSIGSSETADKTFHTYPAPAFNDPCPNALSRQQTGAAFLLDCRSYEIVSAAYAGGYNVESDLVPGQIPYPGYPEADGKVLYAVHAGGIPNSGSPTNRGPDPYVATRGSDGWSTKYVGIPASPSPSTNPFSSTLAGAGSGLEAFAFSGPNICAPCFNDGSAGIPLRLANGELVQGMVGSEPVINPTPAGTVAKPLSADGSHFIFGSTQKFEPDGNSGEISIYDRFLAPGGGTYVVSKTPLGATMSGPASGVGSLAELDVSKDGSRILLGQLVSTDAKGNSYYHLYMNVGDASKTIDLMPTSSTGALYDGMSVDGSRVYFTSKEKLASDGDTSADLYQAEVGTESSTLNRISTGIEGTGNIDACTPASNWNTVSGGPNCDVVAIAGGGGVAAKDGSVFFLSPEKLDGLAKGTADQPNLYIARPGSPPHYVTTLELSNPIVKHGVEAAGTRNTADFQVNPSGNDAVFTTTLSLKPEFENRGFAEVYRYDAGEDKTACISCDPSNAPAVGKASLASSGLSVTDDGRVLFNSLDPLALRDSNEKQDAYEWESGTVELISSGTNENDSSVLSVSADGTDALFFTREKLAPQDENGPVVKIYDAREGGGFFTSPSQQPCKASDECHGAGTVPAPVPNIQSTQGEDGQLKAAKRDTRCKKGRVRKHGKCVKGRRNHPDGHHRPSSRG